MESFSSEEFRFSVVEFVLEKGAMDVVSTRWLYKDTDVSIITISKTIDSRIKVYNSKHVHIMFWTCFGLYKFYTHINQFLVCISKIKR